MNLPNTNKISYKVPANYFEENEKQLIALAKLQSDETFKVPENYFENTEKNLLKPKKQQSKFSIYKIAAIFVLLTTSTFFMWNFFQPKPNQTTTVYTNVNDKSTENIIEETYFHDQEPEPLENFENTDVIEEYYTLVADLPTQKNNSTPTQQTNKNSIEKSSTNTYKQDSETVEIIYDSYFEEEYEEETTDSDEYEEYYYL